MLIDDVDHNARLTGDWIISPYAEALTFPCMWRTEAQWREVTCTPTTIPYLGISDYALLLSVERTGLLNRSHPHRKILRTCVKTDFVCEASGCRNLGHHKSPKSLGASHLRWYFLCRLNLSHWAAGVSITFKIKFSIQPDLKGLSFHSVAWYSFS